MFEKVGCWMRAERKSLGVSLPAPSYGFCHARKVFNLRGAIWCFFGKNMHVKQNHS